MANEEHLKILEKGVGAWNKWRKENPESKPDLSGANLSGTVLSGADLSGAYLRGVNLRDADLTSADLTEAILVSVDFSGAILTAASLSRAALNEAILRHANLRGANLSGAVVFGVTFISTEMAGADFSQAVLGHTIFGDTNLSLALWLNRCGHLFPSIIDYRTLEISENLPIEFLRGCGLSDSLIDWYRTLHLQPIQYYSCFISYSSKNQDFADRLHGDLQNKGVRCWLATDDLKIGDPFRDVIDQAIRLRDKLLLILSKPALQSEWVKDEVEAAFEEERKKSGKQILFPIRIDDGIMTAEKAWAAKLRRQRHIGDFTNWKDHDEYQKAFERLLRDLAAG